MRLSGVIVAVVAVLVAGCSSDEGAPAPSSPSPPTARAAPTKPVPHEKPPPVPVDRDEFAVLATLAKLDPCKLVDTPGDASDPHGCEVEGKNGAYLQFGSRSTKKMIDRGTTTIVAGAKVDLLMPDDRCHAEIPVSFKYAITVLPKSDDKGCAAVLSFASQVVHHLAHPENARQPEVNAVNWDLCTAFAKALQANNMAADDVGEESGSSGRDGCRSGDYDTGLTLLSGYVDDKPATGPPQTIEGKQVRADQGGCKLTWDQGAVSRGHHLLMVLYVHDCATGKALTASVIKTLDSAPPSAEQHPLTYGADEPDMLATAGCRDYIGTGCTHYEAVAPPPRGAQPATQAVLADPSAACAMSVDALHAQFGKQLQPVIDGLEHSCHLVGLTHELDVSFGVVRLPPGEPGPAIHGHATVSTVASTDETTIHTVCLDPGYQDNSTRYGWCVSEHPRPTMDGGAKPDPKAEAGLAPALTVIADAYL